MNNEMLQSIEKILKDTDEIKTAIQHKGYDSKIQIKSVFENSYANFNIEVIISY